MPGAGEQYDRIILEHEHHPNAFMRVSIAFKRDTPERGGRASAD